MKKILSLICLALLAHINVFAQNITAAEYFFDADPGVGKGTAISGITSADSVDINGSINITGLSAGFHVLAIRAKNVNGAWSLYTSRQLYVDVPPANTLPTITAAEYFFDTDPGIEKGTAIPVPTPGDSIDINNSINTTGLSAGFHVLAIRVRNSSGAWGQYASRQLYLDVPPNTTPPNIIAAEYFFDSDPGIGSGTAISVPTPADSIDINSTVSTLGLTGGFHRLAVRVKNANGIWGLYEARLVYIDDTTGTAAADIKVANAEWFIDTDPGVGSANAVTPSFAPADSVDINTTAGTTGLPQGQHYLYVRAQNVKGKWGFTMSEPFTICSSTAPVAQFTDVVGHDTVTFTNTSTGDTAVLWNFGDSDTSTAVNVTHTYTTYGTYTVTLVTYNPCTTDTITHQVTILNYSGVADVTNTSSATIFPSPNDGHFTLEWKLPAANTELQLADITGRIIYTQAIAAAHGTTNINVPTLSSGIYYWRIVAQNKVLANQKIIVLK